MASSIVRRRALRAPLLAITLPLNMPVRVQLKNSDGWEAAHSAPALKNVSTLFKDESQ